PRDRAGRATRRRVEGRRDLAADGPPRLASAGPLGVRRGGPPPARLRQPFRLGVGRPLGRRLPLPPSRPRPAARPPPVRRAARPGRGGGGGGGSLRLPFPCGPAVAYGVGDRDHRPRWPGGARDRKSVV